MTSATTEPDAAAQGQATRQLVGRVRELELLARGVGDALAGRGRLYALVGEPGIGKTRLGDEVARLAAGRGLSVAWGRCWESGGAPAYWPWLDLLGGLVRTADLRVLRDELGPGAVLLGELVPDLRRRLQAEGGETSTGAVPTVLAPALPPSSDEARFELWRAAATLVRRAAEPAGLLLVLEDLHAADEASLLLLNFLAREARSMRLLLLVSWRDVEARLEPAVGELLGRIGREGESVPLARLDREASLQLIARQVGPVALDVAGRIFGSTQGNPLFVQEMAQLYAEEGAEGLAAGVVPEGVRAVIRQRLGRVPQSRPLLELGAVLGDELDPALLAAASGKPAPQVAAELAALTRAGVLVSRGPRPRFSHALLREVLYRDLPEPARRALHGRVAQALERLAARGHGHGHGARLPELAHHHLEGPPELLARAVSFSVQAAQAALAVLAYQEAVLLLERAAAAVEAAGDVPRLRAEVLLALAAARIRGGELDLGKTLCREVAALAKGLDDAELLARAALTYGQVFTFAVVDPVMVDLLEEALAALPAGDSPLRVRLLARLAGALQPTPHMEEPVRLAREAIAGARRLGDPRTLLEALYAAMSAMMDIIHPRERLPLNLEAEQLAIQLHDRETLLRTHGRLAVDHMGLGELAAADARIEAYETLAGELQAPWMLWRAPLLRSARAIMHGRFDEAEAFIAEALRLGHQGRDPQVDRCVVLHREGLLRAAERHDQMRAHDVACRRERAAFVWAAVWQECGSALMSGRLEDLDQARLHLDLVSRDMPLFAGNLFALFHHAEPAALVGDPELVEKLRQAIVDNGADQDVMLGMTQFGWEGPTDRLLALLEARLERWDDCFAHFRAAIARLQRLQARPYLARTRYEYARALLARGASEGEARAVLAAAHDDAQALGLTGLLRLIEARQAALPAAHDDAQAPPVVASVAEAAPAGGGPAPRFSMVSEGEVWAFSFEGTTFRLKDSLGLRYLHRLVAEPERELHVLELAGGRAAGAQAGDAGEVADLGDAGELLDEEARDSYRRRLEDLREELAEAESFGDSGRAGRARDEIEFLGAELGRAVGLGGRGRRAGGAAERARSAVQRRIKNALARIEEQSPALASYLGRAVRTGNFCVFRPSAGP